MKKHPKPGRDDISITVLLVVSVISAVTLEALNTLRRSAFNEPYGLIPDQAISLTMAILAGVPAFLILRKRVPNADFVVFLAALQAFWLRMLVSTLVLLMTGWSMPFLASVVAFVVSYLMMDKIFNQSNLSGAMKAFVAGVAIIVFAAMAMTAPYLAN